MASRSRVRAHPRWRGADRLVPTLFAFEWGSSPLARGRRRFSVLACGYAGLIPAGAGQTRAAGPSCGWRGAHPRWRGADRFRHSSESCTVGSSPLARGRLAVASAIAAGDRLIPAGAGQTLFLIPSAGRCAAHPRWRGADRVPDHQVCPAGGSSPLARGRLGVGAFHVLGAGLIPAGAGQTRASLGRGLALRAHPRWRGADSWAVSLSVQPGGSSPLARGRQQRPLTDGQGGGLIPAGAGQTPTRGAPSRQAGAHPRWRGADRLALTPILSTWGSSPLARGRLRLIDQFVPGEGLIPAGAGQTGRR